MKVGIFGAGAYGAAMAGVLRENGHAVKFYDPIKLPSVSIASVMEFAQVILLAVPAKSVKKLLRESPKEAYKKPLIVTTKGIMDLTLWEEFDYYELVSGPGFADEIRKRRRTKLTVAARGALGGATLSERLLGNDYIKFDKTEDVLGVAMLSGLKNIFAIESGRRNLSRSGPDFKAFVAEAFRESEKFLLYNGGFVETVRLSAGLGDIALTCGGKASRNFQFGELLKRVSDSRKKRNNLAYRTEVRELKKFVNNTTVEGLFATKEIDKLDYVVPKEAEILIDIRKRIKDAIKY